jgi:L-lactate dehydrogenase
MVSARIAEIVLRDEHAVIPIGVFNPKFGATLSMPGILAAMVSAEFWNL